MFLITGATGFIGSHLVEKLCASGIPVRALVRHAGREWPCPTACCDLATGSGLEEAIEGIDAVIHLAGAIKALNPQDYYRANVRASANVARALASRPVRLVHVSSLVAVGPGDLAQAGSPVVDEETEPHPVSQYGRSKLEGERAVRALKPDAIIIRPPVVYGPRDTGVFRYLKSVSRGWSLQIGPDSSFSAVYVHDLVDGLIRAAAPDVPPGRTYFMAHPEPNSWAGFTSAAARIMRVEPRSLRVPLPAAYAIGYCAEIWAQATRRPGIISRDKIAEARHRSWVCDSSRAAVELGWQPTTSLEAGLAETLAWYKEAGWIRY